jgi:hypothetical protein
LKFSQRQEEAAKRIPIHVHFFAADYKLPTNEISVDDADDGGHDPIVRVDQRISTSSWAAGTRQFSVVDVDGSRIQIIF